MKQTPKFYDETNPFHLIKFKMKGTKLRILFDPSAYTNKLTTNILTPQIKERSKSDKRSHNNPQKQNERVSVPQLHTK